MGLLGKKFILAENRGIYFISVDDDKIIAKKRYESEKESRS